MTAQDIVDRVVQKLRAEPALLASRRAKIATLAEVKARWNGLPLGLRLRSRDGAIFTTDQTLMEKADKHFQLKLLVLGHHVAYVRLLRASSCFKFVARDVISTPPPQGDLDWSHDPKHGEQIRTFIRRCSEELAGRTPELQVQLQLVQRLGGSKTDEPQLTNLRPVMPFGFPTEIATVVDRHGEPATGNMDILARTVSGTRRRGGEFVVMELKNPTLRAKDVSKAIDQVIGYATALTVEANGLGEVPDATAYRQLFAPPRARGARPPSYEGKRLVAHAVVVLPFGLSDVAVDELRRLKVESSPPSVLGERLGVGVLLYKATQRGKRWTLDERSFEWRGPWQP